MHQSGEHHANRFEQAGVAGADLMAESIGLITTICLVIIVSGTSVIGASSILASVLGIHLVSSKSLCLSFILEFNLASFFNRPTNFRFSLFLLERCWLG